MKAADKSAEATITVRELTVLTTDDNIVFFEALENPPAPTSMLQDAFTRHRQTIRTNLKAIRGLQNRPSSE
jgi:uncharacterized protein (DUF1778 family)